MSPPIDASDARRVDRSRAWARACAALGILGLALATWLALPIARADGAGVRVLVIDRSPSVARVRSGFDAWARGAIASEARAAHATGERIAVVTFGSDVRRTFGPGDAERLAAQPEIAWPRDVSSGAAESPLDRALALAREIADGYGPLHVAIATDGAYTGADPNVTLDDLARAGGTIASLALPPPDRSDAAVLSVATPDELELGAPIAAVADVAVAATSADAACEIVFGAQSPDGTREVAVGVPPQPNPFRGRVTAALGGAVAGRTTVSARVRWKLADGSPRLDAIPENDLAETTLTCRGRLVVGGIADGAARAALRAVFDGVEGIQWIELDAASALGALGDLDLVVTAGLRDLDFAALDRFLRAGGGWLALAGESWLAESTGSPAWSVSPLRPAPARAQDLVLLVDGSGSMTGESFDAVLAALPAVVDAAPLECAITVCVFAAELGACETIDAGEDRAARRERLMRALPRRAPGGPTHVFGALEALATARARAEQGARAILLSDGRDTSAAEPAARGAAVRARLAAAEVELTLIAAGAEPDRAVLDALREPTSALLAARELSRAELESLFARAIAGERVRREPVSLEPAVDPSPQGSASEFARSVLGAQDPRAARAPVSNVVVTRAHPDAEVLWRAGPDPACAWLRVGAGASAACAFAPSAAADRAFYLPLARALARGAKPRGPRALERDGELVVRGLDPSVPAVLAARVRVAGGADPAGIVVELAPDARDPLRSRSARWPRELDRARAPGHAEVELDGVPGSIALALPSEPEYRTPERPIAPDALARPGGPRRGAAADSSHPALAAVLLAALGALCASAFLGILRRP